MNLKKAIRLIKKNDPKTPAEFRKLGLPLTKEGIGVFREVMRSRTMPFVVKFPLAEGPNMSYRAGKMHSTVEVRKINKLSKFPMMKRHLPKVYYHNRKTGILVMSWHPKFRTTEDAFRKLGWLLGDIVYKWKNTFLTDVHDENVRRGEKGQIIFIDLGY